MITDSQRIDFIAECARLSRTGISFEWDGATKGYRFMARYTIGEPVTDIRNAIDIAIKERNIAIREKK